MMIISIQKYLLKYLYIYILKSYIRVFIYVPNAPNRYQRYRNLYRSIKFDNVKRRLNETIIKKMKMNQRAFFLFYFWKFVSKFSLFDSASFLNCFLTCYLKRPAAAPKTGFDLISLGPVFNMDVTLGRGE